MKSRWRPIAAEVIVNVLTDCESEGITDEKVIRQKLSAAYPFGQRKYHPYSIWLDEIKGQLERRKRLATSVRTYWLD